MGSKPPSLRSSSRFGPIASPEARAPVPVRAVAETPAFLISGRFQPAALVFTPEHRLALLSLLGFILALGVYGLCIENAQNLRMASICLLASSLVLATVLAFLFTGRLPFPAFQSAGGPGEPAPAEAGSDAAREAPSSFAALAPLEPGRRPNDAGFDTALAVGDRTMISRRIMGALLAALEHPVYLVTAGLRVESLNGAAERADRDSDLGSPITAGLLERARGVIMEAREIPPAKLQEAFVWHIKGEPRYFLPRLLALRGDDPRKTIGVAIVLEDVTQFRLMDELKSNFFSTVSHEIKTPLTSIRMAVHMLQAEMLGPLEPRQAALIKTAREDIERLLRLLNNLLDLARFEHGAPQMDWERAGVQGLVDEALGEVQTLLAARNLTMEVDCPAGLPDLCIDRARIQHVLRNLLTNAIKHSPEGAKIRLAVALAENGGVQFSVQDRGPGIQEEHIGRIFDKFYRVPGQKAHGTGLGLSIAREVILAHTGSIHCESEPAKQTTFYFTLPTASQQEQRLARPERAD
jgi:signal transduction histidine kinase